MKTKQILLTAAGFASLGAGIIGIIMPLLPTTPFLLLAALCFSAGNSRFSRFLTKNKYLGSYLEHYRNKTGIPLPIKLQSILFLWAVLLLSMFLLHKDYLFILLPIVGSCVTIHICAIRPARKKTSGN